MFDFVTNLFRTDPVAALKPRIEEINALEPEMKKLSDEGLREESLSLRKKLQEAESPDEQKKMMDELLPRAFALVREAANRTLKQRPFDVQLMGGIVLHQGGVAEMMTGEGKTLMAVAPTYLNALLGRGVHVVTVNEYLARRDAVWMGRIHRSLGLSVSCLVPNNAYIYDPEYKTDAQLAEGPRSKEPDVNKSAVDAEKESFLVQQEFLRPVGRGEAYKTDITYGTNHEFGFDYLRDNLAYGIENQVQREHYFAIIDEVDSILIDEARTPLIISAPDQESSEHYKTFARLVVSLKQEEDYTVEEKRRAVSITEAGIEKIEAKMGIANLYAPENIRLVHYLEESLKAKALFHKDKDYVVKNGEIIIVDEFTGRMLQGRRYNGGLHQAIEAKEGVFVKEESRTYAKVSVQNYFRMYEKVSGMTGTAQTSAEEFHKVYGLEVISIPPNRGLARQDLQDLIYKNSDAKWAAVVKEVKERTTKGQPVLLGTTSIEKNEHISELLNDANIKHEVLNAKNNEREGAIIAQAGQVGAVTVATNVAGRGVDILLGGNPPKAEEAEKVKALGGLHVIGTERHEARRIDNQLRGRAGRQGDPGSSQFYLSLDDDLLRIFGGDRIKSMMERFDIPEDQPIEMGFVSKAVAQAQSRVEGSNFDLRKHLLEYDDVLNMQRSVVYAKRKQILENAHNGKLATFIYETSLSYVGDLARTAEDSPATGLTYGQLKEGLKESKLNELFADAHDDEPISSAIVDDLREPLEKKSEAAAKHPQATQAMLSILDQLWVTHLENLEALSDAVGLRAYGQKDPLAEYRAEARRMYDGFWNQFNESLFGTSLRLATQIEGIAGSATGSNPNIGPDGVDHTGHNHGPVASPVQTNVSSPKSEQYKDVGRNDPCPCGSGKKYKKCHGA